MRAQVIRQFGGPEVFELTDKPVPQPGDGEVLVEVRASGVNPVDYKIRQKGPAIAPPLPATLGVDAAGVVSAVGPHVTRFSVGDSVYGCMGGVGTFQGTLAEYVVADERLLALLPPSLSFREAAALPLVTITAWEGLFEKAAIQPGEQLLVLGATGGVGHAVVQLARQAGVEVYGTVSSPEKAELARELGCRDVVNYRTGSVEAFAAESTSGHGFPVVFDATGVKDLSTALAVLGNYGRAVTIVSRYSQDLSPMHDKSLSMHVVYMLLPLLTGHGRERHGGIIEELTRLVGRGEVRPVVDERHFSLEDAAEAHRYLEDRQNLGKVIVEP